MYVFVIFYCPVWTIKLFSCFIKLSSTYLHDSKGNNHRHMYRSLLLILFIVANEVIGICNIFLLLSHNCSKFACLSTTIRVDQIIKAKLFIIDVYIRILIVNFSIPPYHQYLLLRLNSVIYNYMHHRFRNVHSGSS